MLRADALRHGATIIDPLAVFDAAFRPVWTLSLVTVAGFAFFRLGRHGPQTLNALSWLSINVLLPCLLFSKLCKEANLAAFEGWHWLLLGAWALFAVGLAVGWLSSRLLPRGEPRHRVLLTDMIAFQNAGYVPLPIVACLFPGDDRMLALVMMFVLGIAPLLWSVSPLLIAGRPMAGLRWREIATPPLLTLLFSMALLWIGVPGWLMQVPLGESDLLTWFLAPFDMAGEATIPIILIALGGMLAQLTDRHDPSPQKKAVEREWLFHGLLITTRLMVMPALGFALIPLLGLPPAITVVLLVETLTPTALAISVQVQAYGRPNETGLVGRGLMYVYLAGIVTIPFWLVVYKVVVEPGLGPLWP